MDATKMYKKLHIVLFFNHDFAARLYNFISFDKLRNEKKKNRYEFKKETKATNIGSAF